MENTKGDNTMNTVSSEQEYLVQKIRTQYTEQRHTELDQLRGLDHKVKAPANAFAYIFGVLAAIVMGAGMSLIMTDIGSTVGLAAPRTPGLILGLAGLAMAVVNYPIYKGILAGRRKKYAPQIIDLSDRITRNSGRA